MPKKMLVLIDFQNDFINGSLGTPEAQSIIPAVLQKLSEYSENERVATMDTHDQNYLLTQEGLKLPIIHTQFETKGWEIYSDAQVGFKHIIYKNTFGSVELAQLLIDERVDEVELIGLDSDICVISNAALIRSMAPEVKIIVSAQATAGTTPENHINALEVLKTLQIEVTD
ncbi:cysteine hydrolase [Weissella coleopterorum]|uniref:nicotinamidase n=1 Tax=Weissella coleopterorum TaxID=2714949 RepID=A0A6G8AZR5_9LACO|nr:isochorismatase family cysteine hydrolase [Weissella coleopterorum]QIL50496.1 cysteine hydrolase [Weissella coleopterorum]